ncbi:MAG: HAMP domain-containing protein [Deltaproteobacteria bacterium]|nr:HAMP domain-containing protein [Deltaproteobacteria bacterium]
MTVPRRLGLRARFMIVSAAFVLTTAAAAVWTLFVLTRLAAVTSTMARDSEDTTGATSALTGAIEREDDALLVVLGGPDADPAPLALARARTDAAQRRLRALLANTVEHRLAEDIDDAVAAYRGAGDGLKAEGARGGFDGYDRRVNPHLRLVVAAVARVRDRHFAEARAAAALARTEVAKTRRVVAAIAAVSLLFALAVALRMSQLVVAPLRDLSGAARRIQEGRFETRIDVPPGDEVAQVAAAFNEMAARLEEFRRSNITEVLKAKSALDAMMSALPDALLLVDAAGGVVSSNPAAETLFRRAGRSVPVTVDELRGLRAPTRAHPRRPRRGHVQRGRRALRGDHRSPRGPAPPARRG